MSVYRIDITTSDSGMAEKLGGTTKWEKARRFANYCMGLACGSNKASIALKVGSNAQSSATVTFTTVIATNTVVVGGTTFTGSDTPSGAAQFLTGTTDDLSRNNLIAKINAHTTVGNLVTASIGGVAASGTQTLVSAVATNTCAIGATTFTCIASTATPTAGQFCVGANNTATAANLARAINIHATAGALVIATSELGVVTVTSKNKGSTDNAITLTSGTNITRGAATLANGTAVITLTSIEYGIIANQITLAKSGAPVAVSAAALSGGVNFASTTLSYGQ
jgi:hypothetical protein